MVLGQWARIARNSRRRKALISLPLGRLAGRSTAVTKRPSEAEAEAVSKALQGLEAAFAARGDAQQALSPPIPLAKTSSMRPGPHKKVGPGQIRQPRPDLSATFQVDATST